MTEIDIVIVRPRTPVGPAPIGRHVRELALDAEIEPGRTSATPLSASLFPLLIHTLSDLPLSRPPLSHPTSTMKLSVIAIASALSLAVAVPVLDADTNAMMLWARNVRRSMSLCSR